MKSSIAKTFGVITAMLLCICMFSMGVWAEESYSATSMRLLRYEGEIEILDEEGQPRFIMENARFNSGETLNTKEESTASVELEEERIVTLDEKTSVEFSQQGSSMKMDLKEGTLLLDVENKLDVNEALDIQTSNMTIGIRGTIVYASSQTGEEEGLGNLSESARNKALPLLNQNEAASEANVSDAVIGEAQAAANAANAAIGETAATANAADMPARIAAAQPDVPESVTVFGVLDGNADISWIDIDGEQKTVNVPAGSKAVLADANGSNKGVGPVVSPLEQDDLNEFIRNNLTDEQNGAIQELINRNPSSSSYGYMADDVWTYCGLVLLVAQSASKMYDGTPLTEQDLLVSGLPEGFSVKAENGGSQTDAGTSENPVASYAIYNYRGEDVTAHFANIETVSGQLVVDPAPLTVKTESAEKVYDGTPLVSTEAQISSYTGYQEIKTGQNISYINTQPFADIPDDGTVLQGETPEGTDSVVLYGIEGEVLVHGTNPLTGETREAYLAAGQKLTVSIYDTEVKENTENEANTENGSILKTSIEFDIKDMTEEDIPEEVLRLYADNPAVLSQACQETGWDIEKILRRIELLPETDEKLIEENGILVRIGEEGSTLQDFTNVLINIDSDITDYNGRALGNGEATFVPVTIDPSITVKATGSQTWAGTSENTYEIDWGTAKEGNYIVSEDLGTLTVTPAPAAVVTGTASKVYDGAALTNAEAYITGLVANETAYVTATGSRTEVGTSYNTYAIEWVTANPNNYTITNYLGTLTVTGQSNPVNPVITVPVVLTAASVEKVYDGTPLTAAGVTASGLPYGYRIEAITSGSQTDAGTSNNLVAGYRILNAAGENVTNLFTNVTIQPGQLTVEALQLDCDLGGEAMSSNGSLVPEITITYHNGPHADETVQVTPVTENSILQARSGEDDPEAGEPEATVLGRYQFTLYTGDEAELTVTSDGTEAGSHTLTGTILFTKGNEADYTFSYTNTEYTVEEAEPEPEPEPEPETEPVTEPETKAEPDLEPVELTVTTGSAEKVYDGTPLTAEASLAGLREGDDVIVTATGSITDVGEMVNTYQIDWGYVNPAGYTITENLGTLTVTPAPLTIETSSASKDYDFNPLTAGYSISGLAEGDTVTVTITGSQTEIGSSSNTYTLTWDNASETNYELTETIGTLTVNKTSIRIDAGGGNYETVTFPAVPVMYINGTAYTPASSTKEDFSMTASWNFPDGTELTAYIDAEEVSDTTYTLFCGYEVYPEPSWLNEPVEFFNTEITMVKQEPEPEPEPDPDPDSDSSGTFNFNPNTNILTYTHGDGSVTRHQINEYDLARELANRLYEEGYTTSDIFEILISNGYIER